MSLQQLSLSSHQIRLIAHALELMRRELSRSALWGAAEQAASYSIEEIAELDSLLAGEPGEHG